MGKEFKICVIDACALIAYLRGEKGGEKLRKILKDDTIECFMHAVNLGEVYYDSLRFKDKSYAAQILKDVEYLPIKIVRLIDNDFIKMLGEFKTSYSISYADAFVLALARQEEATIVTTDYHEFSLVEKSGNFSFFWLRAKK